jgi:hypothetical protein
MDLEALLTSPRGFGLTTATPLQRAICRASTGVALGKFADHPHVVTAFGGERAVSEVTRPRLLALLAGIRSAKSLFAAAKAFRASQVCDVSSLKAGEIPRIPIVSFKMDQAHAVFDHLRGSILASEALKSALIGEPTADRLYLRHPSGRPIEIIVSAGSRAGGSLVARWLAGAIFDEAPRMLGQADGVVNLDDALSAIRGRMLPGAQIDLVGSPWAPRGPVYDLFVGAFGRPSDASLVIQAPGPMMNPSRFTPEFCAELERDDPRAYKTDVLAQFADAEDSLLSSVDVQQCTRPAPAEVEFVPGQSYVAAIDPATRANAWTLVIMTATDHEKYQVVLAKQWQGSHSAPLRPRAVLAEIAAICKRYRIDFAYSDQYSFDALRDLSPHGFALMQAPLSQALWMQLAEKLRSLVSSHAIEFPPDPVLRGDLLGINRRLTSRGYSIALASTAGDGRHSDYIPAVCLCLQYPISAPEAEPEADGMDVIESAHIFKLSRDRDEVAAERMFGEFYAS